MKNPPSRQLNFGSKF